MPHTQLPQCRLQTRQAAGLYLLGGVHKSALWGSTFSKNLTASMDVSHGTPVLSLGAPTC